MLWQRNDIIERKRLLLKLELNPQNIFLFSNICHSLGVMVLTLLSQNSYF